MCKICLAVNAFGGRRDLPIFSMDALLVEEVDSQAAWGGEPISTEGRGNLLPVTGRELVDEVGILCPSQRIGPEEPDPPEPTGRHCHCRYHCRCQGSGMQLGSSEGSSSSCTPERWTVQTGDCTPLTQNLSRHINE
jgi:hypothetical protein